MQESHSKSKHPNLYINSSLKQENHTGDLSMYPDESFKSIIDLLAKNRTFQDGICKLK